MGDLLRLKRCAMAVMIGLSGSACAQDVPTVEPAPPIKVDDQAPETIERVQQITLQAGQLPHVRLSADIMYKVLAAEIAVQRGSILPAANTTLELARDTADPRLAQRAVELYAAIGDVQGALNAAEVWQANAPESEEAISTRLALTAAAGQTAGLAEALA
ncbi:MAG TPA: hypothetical protein VIC30_02800, partial [Orrella sp.]